MNTRRKFLLQGSLATTALLTLKPFETLANTIAPGAGYSINNNKIVVAYTGTNHTSIDNIAVQQITALKKNTDNLLVVNAGKENEKNIATIPYDASVHLNNSLLNSIGNYKIVHRGAIKIGIITARAEEKNIVSESNALAAFLKKDQGCHLVVCLSQLGFQNQVSIDDRKLAAASKNIDIIIGGHSTNFSSVPIIARNCNNEEVILHSSFDNGFALGNIEIAFDKDQKKRSIDFNNLLGRV